MRKRMRRAVAMLIALPILGFLGAWLLVANTDLRAQRQYENALLGKTLNQVEAIMQCKPTGYETRLQCQNRRGECDWPSGEETGGRWYKGPVGDEDMIIVMFDDLGLAARVKFVSAFSIKSANWRWRYLRF